MPKTNDQTGASYAGFSGVVEHGAPLDDGRVLSELDPELHLDGTLIEGEHPDHADAEERTVTQSDAPLEPQRTDQPKGDEPEPDDHSGDERPESEETAPTVYPETGDAAKRNLGRPAKSVPAKSTRK
jgi:hypothetical protein